MKKFLLKIKLIKPMKQLKILLLLLILSMICSCGVISEGFKSPKQNNSDEFLIENENNLVVRYFRSKNNRFFTSPLFVAILFLAFSFYRIWPKASSSILDKLEHLLFGILSVTGIFLVFMMLVTEHLDTKNNFNILWINPLAILGVVYNKRLVWLGLAISALFTVIIQLTGAQEIGSTAILLAISLGILYIRRAELARK